MKNLFILLVCWVLCCLLVLVVFPFLVFTDLLKSLCRSLQEINETVLDGAPFSPLIAWSSLILFILFPIFMIPLLWFFDYKNRRKRMWSDFLPFKN